jgi:hypothetical protein
MKLTLTLHAIAVDTGAADHHIVDDGETALASYPIALTVPQAAVGQNSSFVKTHAPTVLRFGKR